MEFKKYVWEIFDIAKENDVDIGVGKDMFVANLNQCKATYHGADALDYAALGAEWAALDLGAQTAQKQLYSDITHMDAPGRYKDLCTARGDREAFEAVVGEAVAALEKAKEDETAPVPE